MKRGASDLPPLEGPKVMFCADVPETELTFAQLKRERVRRTLEAVKRLRPGSVLDLLNSDAFDHIGAVTGEEYDSMLVDNAVTFKFSVEIERFQDQDGVQYCLPGFDYEFVRRIQHLHYDVFTVTFLCWNPDDYAVFAMAKYVYDRIPTELYGSHECGVVLDHLVCEDDCILDTSVREYIMDQVRDGDKKIQAVHYFNYDMDDQ